jgi:RimJ/RimL family protein N-acetyltransferase
MDYEIREANFDDARRLYEWRTDPMSMAASHVQNEFSFDSHVEWLKRSLGMPSRKIYIVGPYQLSAGMVRTDFADGVHELSWIVAPRFRRSGHGNGIVKTVVTMLSGHLRAEIKESNIASRKIAEHAGFALTRSEAGILYYDQDTTARSVTRRQFVPSENAGTAPPVSLLT